MLLEKPSTVVVVETEEVRHHRLYVGLHAFRFPTMVYYTTEGLQERCWTCEDEHMHAWMQQ